MQLMLMDEEGKGMGWDNRPRKALVSRLTLAEEDVGAAAAGSLVDVANVQTRVAYRGAEDSLKNGWR